MQDESRKVEAGDGECHREVHVWRCEPKGKSVREACAFLFWFFLPKILLDELTLEVQARLFPRQQQQHLPLLPLQDRLWTSV